MPKKKKDEEAVALGENDDEEDEEEDAKIRSKKFYIGMIFFCIITCIILRALVAKHLVNLYSFKSCGSNTKCLENQSIYRVSFGAFIFFLIMGIATYVPRTDGTSIHMDWWFFKLLALPLFIGLGFLIPNGFFDIYAEVARVVSGLFLLLQILILVDFAYDFHELLTHENDDEEMSGMDKCMYLGFSATCLILSIAGSIVLYVVYPSCELNTTLITLTFVIGPILVCISGHESVGKGILPPAIVFLYGVWLTFTALTSIPDPACNLPASGDGWYAIILNTLMTAFSVTYVCGQTAAKAPGVLAGAPCCKQGQDDGKAVAPLYWFFHWTLALASLYMAMMLTNWGVVDSTGEQTNRAWENVYLKIIPAWLTFLMFFWTLVAPLCCSNRDFNDVDNRFEKK